MWNISNISYLKKKKNMLSVVFNTYHSMSDDTFAKFFSLAL